MPAFDPAEVIALRLVAGVLVGFLASALEKTSGEPAQALVNDLSTLCQGAVRGSNMNAKDAADVIVHVNQILAPTRFDRGSTSAN